MSSFSQDNLPKINLNEAYPIVGIYSAYFIVNQEVLSQIKKYKVPDDGKHLFNPYDNSNNIETIINGLEEKILLFFNEPYRNSSFFEIMSDISLKILISNDQHDKKYYMKVYDSALVYRQKCIREFSSLFWRKNE